MKRWIIVSGLVAAWIATGASGGPPPTPRVDNVRVSAHDVSHNDDCGFPMQVDAYADVRTHKQYAPDGTLIKTTTTTPGGRMTFTNEETGAQIWTPTSGMTVQKTNPDGGTTFGMHGVKTRIVVPGQGLVFADIGNVGWTVKFDGSGNITAFKLSSSGIRDGVVPSMLCSFLD